MDRMLEVVIFAPMAQGIQRDSVDLCQGDGALYLCGFGGNFLYIFLFEKYCNMNLTALYF